MPMLMLDDGTKMTEGHAIMHYLAALHGFNATNPRDMYTGEFIYARWMEDFVAKYLFETWKVKGEEKEKLVADIFSKHYPAFLEALDSTLLDGNRFLFGQRLSMYDFYIAGFFVNVV